MNLDASSKNFTIQTADVPAATRRKRYHVRRDNALGALACAFLFPLLSDSALAQSTDAPPDLPPPPNYVAPIQPYQPPPGSGLPPYFAPAPVQPQPLYAQPAYAVPQGTPAYRGLSPFRPQVGLGIRGSGLWVANDSLSRGQGGVGLELLFRVHPRVSLELWAQYQYSKAAGAYSAAFDYERTDVPLMAGLRVHVGPKYWVVSPYVVAAAGADYARAALPGATEATWFAELQLGGGLEGRFGRHFALNVDVRGYNRLRSSDGLMLYITDDFGNSVPALRNQYGLLFNVGIAVYF